MNLYLRYIALIGNAAYVLFLLHNAIDEPSGGLGLIQKVAVSGLVVLLILNIVILYRRN